MITLDIATTSQHFDAIVALQRRYHVSALAADVQAREGFVFARHSRALLQRMAAELPQAIALDDGTLVAYCLSMPVRLRDALPELIPMFEQFDRCAYHGRPLAECRYYVGGQVCVERAYRGHRLLARLYERARQSAPANMELCVTEIATRNRISIRAHEHAGFETIATYADARESWAVVAWALGRRHDDT